MSNFAWLCVFTVVSFVAGAALAAAALVMLPEDYFLPKDERDDPTNGGTARRWAVRIVRNVIGVVLVALGVAMLFLPGQGLLTILFGLMLVDFPGKRQFVGKLLKRPKLLERANRFRARFGKPPLRAPHVETH